MSRFLIRRGFTVIELLVTMGIIVILGIITTLNLQGGKNNADLTDTTKQVGTLLSEAQSDSMAQEQGATWGVHFSNATNTAPFYALFTNSYSTATTQSYYRLPATVGYISSSIASGATLDITFAQISGVASASTSLRLYSISRPTLSSTIMIGSSGVISY